GVLIVVFRRDRVARALRVARELDVFLRDVRGRAANFNVGAVRLVDPSERVLALAVIPPTPHALLTVSHDVPVRRPSLVSRCATAFVAFRSRRSRPIPCAAGPASRPRQTRAHTRAIVRSLCAITAATPWPRPPAA